MKALISYFIKYPITANLLMFLIFVFGVVGLNSLRSTFFPEMESRTILVQAISAGLSTIEIEEYITKKIEYKLEAVSGVKNITSSSLENTSSIFAYQPLRFIRGARVSMFDSRLFELSIFFKNNS